jgi:hypothetical protein
MNAEFEGFGRRTSWPDLGTILAFASKETTKLFEKDGRRTECLPSASEERYS